jgi:hypothetical protein
VLKMKTRASAREDGMVEASSSAVGTMGLPGPRLGAVEAEAVPGPRQSAMRAAQGPRLGAVEAEAVPVPRRSAVRAAQGSRRGAVQMAPGPRCGGGDVGDGRRRAWREGDDHHDEGRRRAEFRRGGCRRQGARCRGVEDALPRSGRGGRGENGVAAAWRMRSRVLDAEAVVKTACRASLAVKSECRATADLAKDVAEGSD